jgi:translocation and assembly module TamB
VRALTADAADVARWPAASPDTTPPLPLSERLRVPRLPIPVEIDRLSIDRITLDPSIIGDTVEASLAGQATVNGQTLLVALDLYRTDGNPGDLAFRLELSDTPSVLTLRLTANEPTGVLLGHVLHRGDRPPLLLSLTGKGPVAAWRGRVEASSGSLARFDADLSLAGLGETSVALSGIAAVDRLVPPDIAPLIGERVPVGLRATVKKGGAIALDNLSIELASGTLTGDAALAGPDRAIAAHLRARLTRLAPATGALGVGLEGSAELIATISGTEDRPRLDLNVEGDNIAAAFSGAEHAEAHLTMTSAGNLGDPAARVEIAAHGQLRGITLPDSTGLSSGVSRDLSWSFAAKAAPSFSTVELTEFSARGVGLDLAGSGIFDQAHGTLDGRVQLSVDDPRPFAGLSGRPIEGTVTLDASIAGLARRQITVTGEFRGGGLDGTLALDAELDNPAELAVRRLQVKAAIAGWPAASCTRSCPTWRAGRVSPACRSAGASTSQWGSMSSAARTST